VKILSVLVATAATLGLTTNSDEPIHTAREGAVQAVAPQPAISPGIYIHPLDNMPRIVPSATGLYMPRVSPFGEFSMPLIVPEPSRVVPERGPADSVLSD
jgi:hypothetical protein